MSNTQRTPRKTPRYMMPTEAARRKSIPSRSEPGDLREKYPHWSENQENDSEPERRERSPDNTYSKTLSMKKITLIATTST